MILLFDIQPIKDAFSQGLFKLIESNVNLDEALIDAAAIASLSAHNSIIHRSIEEVLKTYRFQYTRDADVYATYFHDAVLSFGRLYLHTSGQIVGYHWPYILIKADLLVLSDKQRLTE